jgi:hypothetical protein
MKTIIVNSPKYGIKEVYVDDEDFDLASKYNWHINKIGNNFYAVYNKTIKGTKNVKHFSLHRVIMNETNKSVIIDHKNQNGLDNQKINLRRCTKSENNKNKRSKKNSTSKYLGVCKASVRNRKGVISLYYFRSRIKMNNGKLKCLGFYPFTKEGEILAAKAYNEAAKEIHGEFANINSFPESLIEKLGFEIVDIKFLS